MHFNILDAGTLTLIEHWGSDERIIESARMSTGKGFKGWGNKCPTCKGRGVVENLTTADEEVDIKCSVCEGAEYVPGDEKLLRFLWEHKHHTPFEMCGLTIEVQAPIFVFREWHRHRTQSYNEMSARYTPIPDVNYVPTVERCMMQGGKNKQAQGTGATLTAERADAWLEELNEVYQQAEAVYKLGLDMGIPKELARLCIPVGRYSRMRASGNLRNWLAFYSLRASEDAQWEIRQYADAVGKCIAAKFPRVAELAGIPA